MVADTLKNVAALVAASAALISAYQVGQVGSDTDCKQQINRIFIYGSSNKTQPLKLESLHRRDGNINADTSP